MKTNVERKTAILVVSFGTSHNDTREVTIDAIEEALKNACVDPRFKYVTRNSAPYVEWLGIKENPSGTGWASSKNYGYQIVNMMDVLKNK